MTPSRAAAAPATPPSPASARSPAIFPRPRWPTPRIGPIHDDRPSSSAPRLDPGLAATLETPAVVVDLDRMTAAIERMATTMAERGVALRPHAKTHKSLEVGRRQVAAGAVGLTVGTLGEAEVFAAGGLDDLFIAYPLSARGPRAARLAELAARATCACASAWTRSRAPGRSRRAVPGLAVLVEIDSGAHRTGVDPIRAGEVAAAAAELGLDVVGGVHPWRSRLRRWRRRRATRPTTRSRRWPRRPRRSPRAGIEAAGPERRVHADRRRLGARRRDRGAARDLRVRRSPAGRPSGRSRPDAVAAVVVATVVSVDVGAGRFVIDAGAKILGKDVAAVRRRPRRAAGRRRGGRAPGLRLPRGRRGVPRGDGACRASGSVVSVVPNHICPVVNLVDDARPSCRDGRRRRPLGRSTRAAGTAESATSSTPASATDRAATSRRPAIRATRRRTRPAADRRRAGAVDDRRGRAAVRRAAIEDEVDRVAELLEDGRPHRPPRAARTRWPR